MVDKPYGCGMEGIDSDAFIPEEDTIFVSMFSNFHPYYGEAYFAHELGHALSKYIQRGESSANTKEVYLKRRGCVDRIYQNDKYEGEISELFKHPGDRLHTEEDLADEFAYQYSKDFPQGLIECSYTQRNEQGNKYINLSMFPSKNDPHSSNMVRLLHEARAKKKVMSDNCQQLLERYQGEMQINYCGDE